MIVDWVEACKARLGKCFLISGAKERSWRMTASAPQLFDDGYLIEEGGYFIIFDQSV